MTDPRPVTELTERDCGLIMAALDAYAEEHPFPADAARCAELAELIAVHGLALTPRQG